MVYLLIILFIVWLLLKGGLLKEIIDIFKNNKQ